MRYEMGNSLVVIIASTCIKGAGPDHDPKFRRYGDPSGTNRAAGRGELRDGRPGHRLRPRSDSLRQPYLAAALAERATLITADQAFAAAAARHGLYASAARFLDA